MSQLSKSNGKSSSAGERGATKSVDSGRYSKEVQLGVRARLAFIEIAEQLEKIARKLQQTLPPGTCRVDRHGIDTVTISIDGMNCTIRFGFFGQNGTDTIPGFHFIPAGQPEGITRFIYIERNGKPSWHKESLLGSSEPVVHSAQTIAQWMLDAAMDPRAFLCRPDWESFA